MDNIIAKATSIKKYQSSASAYCHTNTYLQSLAPTEETAHRFKVSGLNFSLDPGAICPNSK
jgi:hypothetical protein